MFQIILGAENFFDPNYQANYDSDHFLVPTTLMFIVSPFSVEAVPRTTTSIIGPCLLSSSSLFNFSGHSLLRPPSIPHRRYCSSVLHRSAHPQFSLSIHGRERREPLGLVKLTAALMVAHGLRGLDWALIVAASWWRGVADGQ
ncbi:hypothetical protein M0R45_004563 [Rubus argutus]|uniref:Uncharacterized protein n=1 Tax=Rubus argutus TaxID=59490 RepID=A0AAW1YKP3_RUBAR